MANRFDPETRKYYIEEIEVPHITELLPKQQQFVSDEKYEIARKKGEDNHSMIKMYFDTREIFNDPMLFALDILLKERAKEFGELKLYEQPLYSQKYMFGGTPDVIFENAILDFKSNFQNKLYPSLQIAGQCILAVENKIISDTKNWYIAIYKNAKFRLKPVYNSEAIDRFLSLVDRYYIDQKLNKYLQGEIDG